MWSDQKSGLSALFFGLLLLACSDDAQKQLTIAAAANMQYPMQELCAVFASTHQIDTRVITGSSGKLTAQISAGAPFDVFVSADLKYPEDLHAAGLTTDAPKVYAHGSLVLWTMRPELPLHLDSLGSPKIRHVAIASPETAPYGAAASEAIDRIQQAAIVREKLVFGESIGQASQFVYTGAADLGITAKSVVLTETMSGKGRWAEIPPARYRPIKQTCVIVKRTAYLDDAQTFMTFLLSPKAKEVLEKYGYKVDLD